MTETLKLAVAGLAAILLIAPALMAQEPQLEPKQQSNQDAAVPKGNQLLNSYQAADLQFDNSLSVLLSQSLISSNDLGVDVADVQPALRAQLNLPEGTGLAVTAVPDGGQGAQAGIQPHDVLLSVGDAKVGSTEQLAEALRAADGKPVKIGILRQGKPMTLEATPKSPHVAQVVLSDTPVTLWSKVNVQQEPRYRIGVVLAEADDTLRAHVGLAAGEGLIVTEVFPDAPAAKVGIQPHDVLLILDGKRLTTVDAVNAQIQGIQDREVELKLLRGGKEVSLKIAPQKETAEAPSVDQFHRALTIWSAHGCPAVQAQSSQCTSCHTNPFPEWKLPQRIHDYHMLRQWITQQPAAAGSPQAQVNQLKEQLAKMQETLSTLEASLAASAAKEESQPKPEEKK
jgi:hypothetical protein